VRRGGLPFRLHSITMTWFLTYLVEVLSQMAPLAQVLWNFLWPFLVFGIVIMVGPTAFRAVIDLILNRIDDMADSIGDRAYDFWHAKKNRKLHGTPVHQLDLTGRRAISVTRIGAKPNLDIVKKSGKAY